MLAHPLSPTFISALSLYPVSRGGFFSPDRHNDDLFCGAIHSRIIHLVVNLYQITAGEQICHPRTCRNNSK